MWYWIIGAVLLILVAAGLWFDLGSRLGWRSEKTQGPDPQLAEDLRDIRRDIERGRDGWGAF
ncbi:hypothetical protein FE374_17955 [Georgenia yuyongxinii]|uniref:Uncharacterized protein n=1 Tax=Georgenia yuyongxinii TaxID=2589797 RepID=A0A5B8C873_9MICO|nr:hypothetical protein [Georgenia yuyongxinii]QDC26240.1 hypothetical protein FE374_17955 [Georgenia yuyongxinii]